MLWLRVIALIVLAALGCGEPPPSGAPLVPRFGGPIAITGAGSSWTNEACGRCHERELAAFAGSAHARGLESPRFLAEWSEERLRFCADCHAPLGPPGSIGAHQAIGCAACHVREGEVLRFGSPSSEAAPHPMREVQGDPSAMLCAPCHDFPFPDPHRAPESVFDPSEPLQSTWREWALSDAPARGEGCVDCHMAGADHATSLRRDPRAPVLRVSHRWRGDGVLELSLESTQAVGHSIPTGDVFRHLAVEVSEPGAPAPLARAFLRRELSGHRHVDGVVRIRHARDRRVPPPGRGPVLVRLRAGGAPRPLELRVSLHRAPSSLSRLPGPPRASDPRRELLFTPLAAP